jgi:hypothetical protein
VLSIVLAGYPKLKNDLRRPTLEEIGARTEIFVTVQPPRRIRPGLMGFIPQPILQPVVFG